jgi:putative MATE family efflux protein
MSLTKGSVRSTFTKLWLPMIGGIFAVKAIDLSDAIFIGMLGEKPLAAIGFTFPVLMVLVSLSIGLSAGASSVLSRLIGEGADENKRQTLVLGACSLAVLVSLLMSLIGFFTIETLFEWMGAKDDVLNMASSYMRIWFLGIVLLILPVMVNSMLRATGDSTLPALLMGGTAILNIALNPLFIFGAWFVPEMGVKGAAIATLIARVPFSCAALVVLKRRNLLPLTLSDLGMNKLKQGCSVWTNILRIAGPASLSTSLNPVAMSILTSAVATLGTTQVAAFGLVNKIMSFALVPLLALSAASSPFCGQNSGAGDPERSRQGLLWAACIASVWSVILWGFFYVLGKPLLSLVGAPEATHQHAHFYLWLVSLSAVGYGVLIALSSALNGIGHSIIALSFGGGRAIVLLAPLGYIATTTFGFKGLSMTTAGVNVVMGLLAISFIYRYSFKAVK